MKIRANHNSSIGEVNVIPLLDVVFSILAFFILISAGLAAPQNIGVDLPQREKEEATQAESNQQKEMLVVTLDKEGITRIDQREVSTLILEQEITTFLTANPQGLIVLNAEDPSVSYQQVINKLEEIRKVAGDRVAIATSQS